MNSTYLMTMPLLLIGILGALTVKVPANVTPFEFWSISLAVAVASVGLFGVLWQVQKKYSTEVALKLFAGLLVVLILIMAFTTLVGLEIPAR